MPTTRTSGLRRAAVLLTTMAGIGAGAAAVATPAQATNIDTWSSFWQPCGTYMCLYYSPALDNASWRPSGTADADLANNYFSNGGTGTAGSGQVVANNAASMGNNTTNCNVTTWVYANYTGYSSADNNWLHAGHAGNLTSHLRNNERSIKVNSCT